MRILAVQVLLNMSTKLTPFDNSWSIEQQMAWFKVANKLLDIYNVALDNIKDTDTVTEQTLPKPNLTCQVLPPSRIAENDKLQIMEFIKQGYTYPNAIKLLPISISHATWYAWKKELKLK